jgi:hypothetical protein
MSGLISINSALCLPVSDVEALSKGRMVAALSRTFVNTVQHFALCPVEDSRINASITIKFWAKLEFCKIYSDPEEVDKLAQLTIWSSEELHQVLQERYKLFLLCLRIFKAPEPIEISADRISLSKIGGFIKLPSYISINSAVPVLADDFFNQRKQQLVNLETPVYPELEELEAITAQLTDAKGFNQYLQSFLGWTSSPFIRQLHPTFPQTKEISMLGDRSIEEDTEKKSNYRAGTDFENVVRDALRFLGFKAEEEHKGGAGGLDLFCSSPYSLAVECKAGKSIPDRAVEELDRIGKRHLEQNYMKAVRLIIGSGQPTKQLRASAITSQVSIINAMTLQKLVELHEKYPIDLIELRNYLIPGQADSKVGEYIDKVYRDVKLRSQVVQSVKELSERDKQGSFSAAEIRIQYNNKYNPYIDSEDLVRELLIELSSPLTGFVGRRKGGNGGDRFYFLRPMPEIIEQ